MLAAPLFSQQYKTSIEPYPGLVKADARLILQTGFLVVPENRKRPNGRKIKLPFFYVRRPDQDAQKNVTLYTTGGPGYSTTYYIDSISYNSGFLLYGGFIALDQRGTSRAKPCLDCKEVDEAIKQSYRQHKNRDSLVHIAIRQCREKFLKQGIDISSYNTEESAEDINDLRLALGLDSLNLVGISYSGGLMLATASQHPEAVSKLILNSPLPAFSNYSEDGLLNMNEALDQIFLNCEKDSSDAYHHLRTDFHNYFTSITGKQFSMQYLEKGSKDSTGIAYTKNELLDAVINRMNTHQVSSVPAVIKDIIQGNHQSYVTQVLNETFSGDPNLTLGMRYSILCGEDVLYSKKELVQQQNKLVPWLADYAINNVDHPICNCWKVAAASQKIKAQVYSNVPALISAGDIDPYCRPFYNRLIKRYLPNSQLLIFHNRGHGAGFNADGINYLDTFMKAPGNKLVSQSSKHIVE